MLYRQIRLLVDISNDFIVLFVQNQLISIGNY